MSDSIVRIVPKKGSRRFKAIGGMTTKFISEENGKQVVKKKTDFRSERFPKTRQMFRPVWSNSRSRYLMDGFDGDNAEELNALVKKCKLKYPKGHPNESQYIQEADMYDYNDPFLTHKDFKIIAEEGTFSLDKNVPMQKLLLSAIIPNHLFQIGSENNPSVSGRVKYIIIDDSTDKEIKKENRSKKVKVYAYYDGLSDDKKMKIAMGMRLISDENMDRSIIDDILFQAAEDPAKQDEFIEFCEMDSETLNQRFLVGKAKAKGILRFKSSKIGYLLFGKPVGRKIENVYDHISDPENSETLMRLQEALELEK